MNCEKVYQLTLDFLDSNLSPETTRAISDHLASCKACRDTVDAEQKLEDRVSSSLRHSSPDDEAIWSRALEKLPKTTRTGSRRNPRILYWGFSAVAAVAAAVLILLSNRQPSFETLITDDYQEYLSGNMQLAVESSHFEDVSAYFQEQLDLQINACEPLEDNLRLVGGRTCYLNSIATALLIFHDGNTPVSVFVLPDEAIGQFAEAAHALHATGISSQIGDIRLRGQQVGDRVICAVGGTDDQTLDRLIESICVIS
jgi:anti-sigma factor RsiW